MSQYDLQSLNLPRLYGGSLSLFASLAEGALSPLLLNSLLENGGIPRIRKAEIEDAPTFYPLVIAEKRAQESLAAPQLRSYATKPRPRVPFATLRDYAEAYREGRLTPVEAAERILAAVEESERGDIPLRAFIAINREDVLRQAEASAARIKAGKALSLLDGVPVAVKDEVDMLPYPTTVGTSFLGRQPAQRDSHVAARLRAAGALLIGKTNMHEIGINPDGSNVHHGRAANPYDPRCDTGGSSSGSAVAAAAGFCPAAIGADGGGSIRIPAGLCGLVGLKPTYGRVSERGAAPLCWSVAHLGPLAVSVEDAALIYGLVAGPDAEEPNSCYQPPVSLEGWDTPGLKGVRLGIFPDWFEHADREVVAVNQALVEEFKAAGAEIREVSIPELDLTRVAHALTILTEMAACMASYPQHQRDFAPSTRLSLVIGRAMSARDYLQAQRMRTRAMRHFAAALEEVDAILTPATGLPAPLVPPAALSNGWSDLSTTTEMMRFVFPANLTGNPAVSFPAGYSTAGLPIGMQAIGRHWEEALLLRIASAAEQVVERRLPKVYFPILNS